MRRFAAGCSLWIMTLLSSAVFAQEPDRSDAKTVDGIDWRHDLDEAILVAKELEKPLMTYFTFNTCHWCHKLEEDTFSNSSVIQRSGDFVWVKVNRDVTPEACRRFNISAYPSLMVLGDDQEKIYRFSGYKLPDAFLPELDEAERRYKLYREGAEWDLPPHRAAQLLGDEWTELAALPAPNGAVPAGFAFVGKRTFLALFMDGLYEIDPHSGVVLDVLPLPPSVTDICSDGELIYGITSGWTAGQPIYVIDPDSGEVIRQIVTIANAANGAHGAKGIEFINDTLVVLEGMRGTLRMVNTVTGDIIQTIQSSETWISGLAYDGEHLLSVAKDRIVTIDPTSGRTVRSTSVNYPLRSVGVRSKGAGLPSEVWLMEQPVWGYNIRHERVQVWPRVGETLIYRLIREQKNTRY